MAFFGRIFGQKRSHHVMDASCRRKSRKRQRQLRQLQTQGVECWISGKHRNHENDENHRNPGANHRFPNKGFRNTRVPDLQAENHEPGPLPPFEPGPRFRPAPPRLQVGPAPVWEGERQGVPAREGVPARGFLGVRAYTTSRDPRTPCLFACASLVLRTLPQTTEPGISGPFRPEILKA